MLIQRVIHLYLNIDKLFFELDHFALKKVKILLYILHHYMYNVYHSKKSFISVFISNRFLFR